jgi:mitochondrial Rho GTPase 1
MEVCLHLPFSIPSLNSSSSMTTVFDHKITLAYLAYLGYPDEPRTSALQITRARKIDRRKGKVSRNVFLCYVCGAAGSGKTSLLRAFLNKAFEETYEPTSKMMSAVNAVDIGGSEKYLVVSVLFMLVRFGR